MRVFIADDEFIAMANERNMPKNALDTLLAMFNAYNKYGFLGNDFDTKMLLEHCPNDFATFVKWAFGRFLS